MVSAEIKKGDSIGFSQDRAGRFAAVIRTDHRELPPGAYTWTMKPDAGQIDPVATTVLVVAVSVAVAVGIGVAVAAASPFSGLNAVALGGL